MRCPCSTICTTFSGNADRDWWEKGDTLTPWLTRRESARYHAQNLIQARRYVIGTIWAVWAVLAALGLVLVISMENQAKKVDGASGWALFGWFGFFVIWCVPILALVSLGIWLFQTYW